MTIGTPFPVQGQFACSVCGTLLGFYVNDCPQCTQNALLEEANRIKREELRYQQERNQQTSCDTQTYSRPVTDQEYDQALFRAIQLSIQQVSKPEKTSNPFMVLLCLCVAGGLGYLLTITPLSMVTFTLVGLLFLSIATALWYSV
jgi:hypothetical protein